MYQNMLPFFSCFMRWSLQRKNQSKLHWPFFFLIFLPDSVVSFILLLVYYYLFMICSIFHTPNLARINFLVFAPFVFRSFAFSLINSFHYEAYFIHVMDLLLIIHMEMSYLVSINGTIHRRCVPAGKEFHVLPKYEC